MRRCTAFIGLAATVGLHACSRTPSPATQGPASPLNRAADLATRTGVATLSWMPPRRNLDGSALNDLAGYVIYYGKEPANLNGEIRIFDPYATTHTIDHLDPGTYYFRIVAVTTTGARGGDSSLVSKTIP
jgi:hypothetical protein